MPVKPEHLADEAVDTDFLIIGAGMAALRAGAEGNIDVAVMERPALS